MNEPLEMLTTAEAARRIACGKELLARRIEKAGLKADGFLLEGVTNRRSELYVVTRLPQLAKIVEIEI